MIGPVRLSHGLSFLMTSSTSALAIYLNELRVLDKVVLRIKGPTIGNQPASCWPSRVIISGDVHGRRSQRVLRNVKGAQRSVDRGQMLRVF
uniref:Secreted protein n=1 Tax=Utricularia reniformis TaxID=192314 RepID=A0A1Y0B2H9_9LAMI|nr:hypothetical protein AEK19_MT1361 [Utricularia reniformis]ART31559.1 hypothetical protein AEK19_MT1361 [Utricularia reniformis]